LNNKRLAKIRAESASRPIRLGRTRAGAAQLRDPVVAGLVELGLTRGEARAYSTLVAAHSMAASEVAGLSGLALPKAYEALRQLRERGFCEAVAADGATRFIAVPPAKAIAGWVRYRDLARQLESEREAKLREELVSALPESGPYAPDVELTAYLEAVVGRLRTTDALRDLPQRAKTKLDHMSQPPFVQPRAVWNLAEVEAINRGVRVRTIYPPSLVEDEERWKPLVDAGADVRISADPPMKLIIRDGEEAMLSLRDPNSGELSLNSVVVRHPDLVNALDALFEREWQKAKPIDSLLRRRR